MMLREYAFFNGAKRRAELMKGYQMHLGQDETDTGASPSWAAGLLDFAKSASALVNQQRLFNQNLSVARAAGAPVVASGGTVVRQAPAASGMSMQNIILLGAAGVLGLALFKSMGRR